MKGNTIEEISVWNSKARVWDSGEVIHFVSIGEERD